MARKARFELQFESAAGRRRTLRWGAVGLTFAAVFVLTALAFLAIGVAHLPSWLSRSLQTREMDVLLARRLQLGERLRLLAARFEQLELESSRQEQLVQRVRRLYGLPALGLAPEPPRRAEPVVDSIFTAAVLHVSKLDAKVEARLSNTDSLLVSLSRWEAEHRGEAESVPARLPVRALDMVPTTMFGPAKDPYDAGDGFHAGLDLAAPLGTTVVAPASGVVRWAGEPPPSSGGSWWQLGKTVVVAHGERYRTLFGHCDRILVRVGQRVESGQPIATVGASGRALSPRLHYEVRWRDGDGTWLALDPLDVLLDLDRLEGELGATLRSRSDIDPSLAPPLPGSYSR